MNRRDAIKSMGLLAGAVAVAPSVLGSGHDPDYLFAVGDLIHNPRTGDLWRVKSVAPNGNPSFDFNWTEAKP